MPIKNKSGIYGKIRILRKKTLRTVEKGLKKPKRISRKIRHFLTRRNNGKKNPKRNNRITKIKRGGGWFSKKTPETNNTPKQSFLGFIGEKANQTRKNMEYLGNKTVKSISNVGESMSKVVGDVSKVDIIGNLKTVLKDPSVLSKSFRGFKNKFVGLMKEVINPVNVEGGGFSNSFFLQYLDIRSVKLVYNLNVDPSISDVIIQTIKEKNLVSEGQMNKNPLLEEENGPSEENRQVIGGDGSLTKDIDVFIGGLTNSFYIYQTDTDKKPIGNYISFGALNRATIIDQPTFEKLVASGKYKGATNTNTGYICFAKEFEPFYRLLLLIKFNINRFLWTAKSAKVTADLTIASFKSTLSAIVSSPKGITTIASNMMNSEAAEIKEGETETAKNDTSNTEDTKKLDADPKDLETIFEEPFYYLLVQMKAMCLNSSNETFKTKVKSGAQADAIKNSDTVNVGNDIAMEAVKANTAGSSTGGNNESLSSNQNNHSPFQDQKGGLFGNIMTKDIGNITGNINDNFAKPLNTGFMDKINNGFFGRITDGLTGRIKRKLKTFFEFEDKGWGITSSIRKGTGFDRYFPKFMEHEARIALIQTLKLLKNLRTKKNGNQLISDYINTKKLLEKSNFVKEFNEAKCNEITINNKIIDLNTLSDFESNAELVAFLDQDEQSINTLAKQLSQMANEFEKITLPNDGSQPKGGSFSTRKNQRTLKGRKPKNHRRTQKGGLFIFPYKFREIMECCFNYAYQQMVGRIMKRLTKISETTNPPTGNDVVLASKRVPMYGQLINLYSKIRFAILMGLNRSFFSVGNWMLPVGATPHLIVYMYLFGLSVYHDIAYAGDPTFSKEFIALNGKIIFKTLLPAGKKLPMSEDDPNPYKLIVGGTIIKIDENGNRNSLNIQPDNTIVISTITTGLNITFSLQTQIQAETKTKKYVYEYYEKNPIFFAQNGVFVGSIYAIEQNGEECSIQFKKWKYDNKKTNLVPVEGDDKSIINKYFSLIDITSFIKMEFNQVIPYVFQSPNYYLNDDYTLNKNHVHTHLPLTYETINAINAPRSEPNPECTTIQTNGVDTFSPDCEYAANYIYLGKIQKVTKSNNILRGNDLVFNCDMSNEFSVTKPVIGNIELYKVKPKHIP